MTREHTGDKAVGLRIKAARNRVGLSQIQVGERMGKTQAWVSAIETGLHAVRGPDLRRLAAVLETTPATILGIDGAAIPGWDALDDDERQFVLDTIEMLRRKHED